MVIVECPGRMKANLQQEAAMGAKSKTATVRKHVGAPPRRRARNAGPAAEAWEQLAQVPEERDDEIDCERIVQGDGGRRLPSDFDDYN